MKFRIIKYYDRYKAQVLDKNEEYHDIGSPTGYHDVNSAKNYCEIYKANIDDQIVEEFEL